VILTAHSLALTLASISLRAIYLSGVAPALLGLCRHENFTLVYRNIVVLLNLAQAPQNLEQMKKLNVVLLEPILDLCEVLCTCTQYLFARAHIVAYASSLQK
jgi:hypothetical protein